jgi:hypothetical protein
MNLNKVSTITKLADVLGVDRRSLTRWRADYDDTPQPDEGGTHSVQAWVDYIEERGLNQSNRTASANDSPEVADWKEEKIRLECERISIHNAKLAGTLMEASEVESGLSALLGGLRQAINNLPGRLADKVLHITDHHEAEEIITEEANVLLKTLGKCEFLDALKNNT